MLFMNRLVYGCFHKQSDALSEGENMIINKGSYEADHINENLTEGIAAGLGLIIE